MNELKQIVFTIFDTQVEGADVYNNNGSTWLIFTNKKKWVFELTKEGTLWYNYYFFKNFFELLSLEVTENQNYITEWVENFIQNGVKHTLYLAGQHPNFVDDTIQNGVKRTELGGKDRKIDEIKDIVENGVKETKMEEHHRLREVVQTVKNGIKETTPGGYLGSVEMKGKTVHQFESPKQNNEVEDVIENKVKETSPHFLEILNPINFEPVIKEMKRMNEVNIVLEEGIKETKYCELHSLMRADHIIRDGIKETWGYTQQPQIRVNEVVNLGIKETNWRRVDNHPTFLDNIIKSNKM